MVVAGHFVHTGTPVVLWMDPGGYDAYRVERRFSPWDQSDWATSQATNKNLTTPNRYSVRRDLLTANQLSRVRGGGWDLELLQEVVDQFVLHFDACGTSRQCFKVLHDVRGLSVHFMLDLDGTIYQTLDLKERAWHATSSNSRSIGIEIAHIGAFSQESARPLQDWYEQDESGRTAITIPETFGDGGLRRTNLVLRPARAELIRGEVQGRELAQYDYTPQQYAALIQLTAALCRVFPRINCDYPRDGEGKLITRKLEDSALAEYSGVLGHFHIQTNKVDPGPAFQWEKVIREARRKLKRAQQQTRFRGQ